jgi:hypothetical protein
MRNPLRGAAPHSVGTVALRGSPIEHGESVDGLCHGFAEPAEEPFRPGVGLGREEVDCDSPAQGFEEARD